MISLYSWRKDIEGLLLKALFGLKTAKMGCSYEASRRLRSDYHHGIVAFARSSRWDEALDHLAEMEIASVQRDVVSFSALMHRLTWARGLQVAKAMKTVGCEANSITWNSLSRSSDCWRKGVAMLPRMRERQLDVKEISVGLALDHLSKAGLWRSSYLSFHSLNSVEANTIMANAALKSSDWRQGLEFRSMMSSSHLEASLLTEGTMVTLCRDVWLKALSSTAGGLVSLNSAISACERASQWLKAMQIFSHLLDVDEISVAACISSCEKSHQWLRALKLLGLRGPRLAPQRPPAPVRRLGSGQRPCTWRLRAAMWPETLH